MHTRLWFVAVLTCIGCVENQYTLELQPDGSNLKRNLTVERKNPPPARPGELSKADEQAARLAKIYGIDPPPPTKTITFQGAFRGRLPDDVGGHGTYLRWDSPLGDALVYIERFRGNDDAASELARCQKAANRITDLLLGWLAGELENEPGWLRLRKFLDEKFRRDLYNVAIYAWSAEQGQPLDQPWKPPLHLMQYLVERNYFSYEEIPELLRALGDLGREKDERWLKHFQRFVESRMAPDGGPPPSVEFFGNRERLQTSLKKYLETTEEYAPRLEYWKEAQKTNPTAVKPDPGEVLIELAVSLIPFQLGGDDLAVALKTKRAPILTNGQFAEESQSVLWSKRRLPKEHFAPLLIYALWAEPATAEQAARFGKVVLDAEQLVQYCAWYQGLTVAERAEWDGFVATLKPGPALRNQLRQFHFKDEPEDLRSDRRLSREPVDVLIDALDKSENPARRTSQGRTPH